MKTIHPPAFFHAPPRTGRQRAFFAAGRWIVADLLNYAYFFQTRGEGKSVG